MTSALKKLIFVLCVVISSALQGQTIPNDKPNILWIVCEDISPYIGIYGEKLVKTPNIDQLAKEGIRYTNAFTTAGVCAPSRSAIITGMYQTAIGTQHMRTGGDPQFQPVSPYSAVVPPYVKCFPEYLRMDGYYCTNNEKQDYQFVPPVTVWDENSPAASWRNRPENAPFFSVFNFAITHEVNLFTRQDDPLTVDPKKVDVPSYYTETETVRKDIARQLTNIELMDRQVGELIRMLKQDGLYDNTIIFFYSDHGGALPWSKRELLDRGLHIPLIVKLRNNERAGQINDELISGVDFAPTVLSIAGLSIPYYMQGQAFLGSQTAEIPRKYIFAARDRMDTEYDRVRAVRDKRFKYIYNYMPDKPYYQNIEFRESIPLMKEILKKKEEGTLNEVTLGWFKSKPIEELYDTESDPDELQNLAGDPKYLDKLQELKGAYHVWTTITGDRSNEPEQKMITDMWGGSNQAPKTAEPFFFKTKEGVRIICETEGASIGYKVLKAGEASTPEMHKITSWDFRVLMNPKLENGQPFESEEAWQVYTDQPIPLKEGDMLLVNAMRIGFIPAVAKYEGK